LEDLKGRDHWEDLGVDGDNILGVDGRIILKWNLEK
jgi:hypothetical protein